MMQKDPHHRASQGLKGLATGSRSVITQMSMRWSAKETAPLLDKPCGLLPAGGWHGTAAEGHWGYLDMQGAHNVLAQDEQCGETGSSTKTLPVVPCSTTQHPLPVGSAHDSAARL